MKQLYFYGVMALFALTAISFCLYFVRRWFNWVAFVRMEHEEPVRELSDEERLALKPFLISAGASPGASAFKREGVFILKGRHQQHGMSVNGIPLLHHTINGVDVLLPYDAERYLASMNEAEVVLTQTLAIVISLNGEFNISDACLQEQSRRSRRADDLPKEQWQLAAEKLAVEDEQNSSDIDESIPAVADAAPTNFVVEPLGERSETPLEVAQRNSPGRGIVPASLFFPGLILALFAGSGDTTRLIYFGIPACTLIAGGLWFGWRASRPGVPGSVARYRGQINFVPSANPSSLHGVQITRIFLGNEVPLYLPERWLVAPELKETAPLEVDIRVSDQAVLRLGKRLSVEDEQRRRPMVFWHRHMAMALLGFLTLAFASTNPRSETDLMRAFAWMTGRGELTYNSAEALIGTPPMTGSFVRIAGDARCLIRTEGAKHIADIDCRHARFGGELGEAAKVQMPSQVEDILNGELPKTVYPDEGASVTPDLLMLVNPGQLIIDTHALCLDPPTPAAVSGCAQIRLALSSVFGGTWSTLLEEARSSATGTWVRPAFLDLKAEKALEALFLRVARAHTEAATTKVAGFLYDSQHGGIVVSNSKGSVHSWENPVHLWNQLQAMSGTRRLEHVDLEGLVIARDQTPPIGVLAIELDERHGKNDLPVALFRLAIQSLGLLLLCFHGVQWIRLWRAQVRREQALTADASNNHASD